MEISDNIKEGEFLLCLSRLRLFYASYFGSWADTIQAGWCSFTHTHTQAENCRKSLFVVRIQYIKAFNLSFTLESFTPNLLRKNYH